MAEINWYELPYNHAGRWEKKYDSIMDPGSKVTWPQFVAEMVIYWRIQFLKDYRDIKVGHGWHNSICKAVRDLNQQAAVICNYFPHPDDEKIVEAAFRNFFRRNRPMKIGRYRKVRFTEKGSRKVLNITQDEQDVVRGITHELEQLRARREIFTAEAKKIETKKDPKAITFNTTASKPTGQKVGLAALMELEKQLKQKQSAAE